MLTNCANCKTEVQKWPYQIKRSPIHFCNNKCKGSWMSENCSGSNGYNWKGGKWNNRKQILAHTSYRTWRKKNISNKCILCSSTEKLELHHIVPRKDGGTVKDENNVSTLCSICHDILHSNNSKSSELLENLKRKLKGNQQPSSVNGDYVAEKVQRLMGEEPTNKPDTSAAPERDDIVRAIEKSIEVVA